MSDGVLVLAEGVADSDDGLAGIDSLRIAEGDGRKVANVIDLEIGNIVERIGADEGDFVISFAAIEDDFDGAGAVDDVFIGQDVAVFRDDHAGTGGSLSGRLAEKAGSAGLGYDRDDTRSDF